MGASKEQVFPPSIVCLDYRTVARLLTIHLEEMYLGHTTFLIRQILFLVERPSTVGIPEFLMGQD
ncbi:hypothetical protein EYZ11_004631 [Aspergillus tanneri]|uniref:Uncharacterized protein n=1 Tax=Aspergillus tanneri TaxID=1220188 RepID=A0A4S3JKM6_9EURO|nr:hypothetical protein EYZ11_004631 [Aspergillus tanneri]